jgi:hypothetical protein
MDEQRLGDLFRTAAEEAARTAPPPTFDHGDVVTGSRRLARRQRVVVGGAVAAFAAVVLVGAGAALVRMPGEETPALAQPQPTYSSPEAGAAGDPAGSAAAAPVAPDASGPADRDAGPQAAPAPLAKSAVPGGPGCAEPDIRVFAQLASALPGARSTRPYAVPGGCPAGGVGVALDVADNSVVGGARGTLYVVVVPAGVDPATPADDLGTASAVAPTRSGGHVRVTAMSSGGQTPYRQRLNHLASQLAGRL